MLILFHSKYGQTQKIAETIASLAITKQWKVESFDTTQLGQIDSIDKYDVVLIGAPIYTGRHSKHLARFIKSNRKELSNKRTGFFSVSLSAAGAERQRSDATRCMNEFLQSCDWLPTCKTIFAGGLPYTKYGWFIRFIMKRIARKEGGDTDTSRNHEYTDWAEVERFGTSLLETSNFSDEIVESKGANASCKKA